jgi:hypothetical protein
MRVALWSQLPMETFCELLEGVQSCGVEVVWWHEGHAVLRFQAGDRTGTHGSEESSSSGSERVRAKL